MEIKICKVFMNNDQYLAKAWFNPRFGGIIAIKEQVYHRLKSEKINKPENEQVLNVDEIIDKKVTASFYPENESKGS